MGRGLSKHEGEERTWDVAVEDVGFKHWTAQGKWCVEEIYAWDADEILLPASTRRCHTHLIASIYQAVGQLFDMILDSAQVWWEVRRYLKDFHMFDGSLHFNQLKSIVEKENVRLCFGMRLRLLCRIDMKIGSSNK